MAFTSPMTAVTGAVFTAAQFNTNVRDNLNAIWVGTTAGDIDYYTSATAKARVGIGGAGAIMYSTGSGPAWFAAGPNGALLYGRGGGGLSPTWLSVGGAGSLLYSDGTLPAWKTAGTTGALLYGAGSAAPNWLAIGSAGQFLKTLSGAPAWATLTSADVGKKLCVVYNSTAFSIVGPSYTINYLTFDSEIVDVDGWHDPSVNPARITPAVAGYYHVEFRGYWSVGSGQCDLYKNNITKIDSNTSNLMIDLGAHGIYMNGSTDYFNVTAFHTGGAVTYEIAADGSGMLSPVFSASLIGV